MCAQVTGVFLWEWGRILAGILGPLSPSLLPASPHLELAAQGTSGRGALQVFGVEGRRQVAAPQGVCGVVDSGAGAGGDVPVDRQQQQGREEKGVMMGGC